VRGWILGMWRQEVRQYILMPTSICWKNSCKHFWPFHPYKNPAEILLQHDSARPHTSEKTWEAITYCSWIVLHHSPCSSDLAPSASFRAVWSPEGGYPPHEVWKQWRCVWHI
jgi:hypothetical protein